MITGLIIFVFKNTDKLKIIRVKVCTANLHSIAHHTHSPVIEANPSSDAVVIGQSLFPIRVTGRLDRISQSDVKLVLRT